MSFWGIRGAAVCAVAIAVTLLLLSQQGAVPGHQYLSKLLGQPAQSLTFSQNCDRLQGDAQQLCQEYANTQGEDRWTAAAAWRKASPASYACSGITADCLYDDMLRDEELSTCRPLHEGDECDAGQQCWQGWCGGPPAGYQDNVQASSAADVSFDAAAAAAAAAADGDDDDEVADFGYAVHRQLAEEAGAGTAAYPINAWPTATASVNISNWGRTMPDTFVATSHEYHRVFDYGDPRIVHAWAEVFNMLSPSPVIRIGGASQDKMTKIPGDDTWGALMRLQKRTNCRFIFGLPLWQKNAVELSKALIYKTQKYLGNSVIGYELGNEPEFWPNGLGGYDKNGKWQSGFEAFADYFHRIALQLNPCGSGKKTLSGPGWGNVNTQPHKWLARIMYTGKDCYLWEVNVHYYPYINNETVTASQLLAQPLQDFGLEKYMDYQKIADSSSIGLRISETNSLYGGGRPELSDTFCGTLWVADALFAFGKAGARAFHLHWGIGGHPTGTLGQPNTGIQTNFYYQYKGERMEYKDIMARRLDVSQLEEPVGWPSVHAPWYGYLFFTAAAAGDYGKAADSNFIGAKIEQRSTCKANIKIHALKSNTNGDLRIALLNKDESKPCNIKVLVDKVYCSKTAELTRLLPGPKGMKSKGSITFQGQTYDNAGYEGKIQGTRQGQPIKPKYFKNGSCGFELPMPATSGAIVVAHWG